MLLSPAQQANS